MKYHENKFMTKFLVFFIILTLFLWLIPGNLIYGEDGQEEPPPETTVGEEESPPTDEQGDIPPEETTGETDTGETTPPEETPDILEEETGGQPVLTIEIVLPQDSFDAGSSFTYLLKLTNNGDGDAAGRFFAACQPCQG